MVNNSRDRHLRTFVKIPSENPQHNFENEGGGVVKGFLYNVKKTALLVGQGFPKDLLITKFLVKSLECETCQLYRVVIAFGRYGLEI